MSLLLCKLQFYWFWYLNNVLRVLFRNLAKVTIGAGAVYVTVTQGVWSSNTQSSVALDRVQTTVLPATNEYLHKVFNITAFCAIYSAHMRLKPTNFLVVSRIDWLLGITNLILVLTICVVLFYLGTILSRCKWPRC